MKPDRSNETRPFCSHCGARRYESKMSAYPLPLHGLQTGISYYCKGYYSQSECEQAAMKAMFARLKLLKKEVEQVTAIVKEKRQYEIR